MANNDYWAYLRSSNELKHYRVSIENGGSPNGFRKDGSPATGRRAVGVRDAKGNYIYDTIKNTNGKLKEQAKSIGEAMSRRQNFIPDQINSNEDEGAAENASRKDISKSIKEMEEKFKNRKAIDVRKKIANRFLRSPRNQTVAVDANTGRVIPGYNPSLTENTGYGSLGEKWRKNKPRS